MHVLILPSWYFSAHDNGISGRMFHQLAKELRHDGVDARVLYAELSLRHPFSGNKNVSNEDEVPTWRYQQFALPKRNNLLIKKWCRQYARLLKDYIAQEGKPDIIHAQSFFTAMVCTQINAEIKIPFIYTERLSGFASGTIPSRFHSFIRESCQKAHAVTVVSPGLQMHLQKFTSRDIEVIPNSFDPSIFYTADAETKNNVFTFISVGEPAPTKGLDLLIEALGLIRKNFPEENMQLVIVDEVREKPELIRRSTRLGVNEWITWTGLISQPDVAQWLQKSHVLISASRIETFGKAILEAQACGLPVIATKTDGAMYIMQSDDQGMLTDPGSAEALATAMMTMKKEYFRYNASTIEHAVSLRFSRDVVIAQWKALYLLTTAHSLNRIE